MNSVDLVITYGISDIQLLLKDNDNPNQLAIAEPHKESVKDLHTFLLEHLDQVEILLSEDEPVKKPNATKNHLEG